MANLLAHAIREQEEKREALSSLLDHPRFVEALSGTERVILSGRINGKSLRELERELGISKSQIALIEKRAGEKAKIAWGKIREAGSKENSLFRSNIEEILELEDPDPHDGFLEEALAREIVEYGSAHSDDDAGQE